MDKYSLQSEIVGLGRVGSNAIFQPKPHFHHQRASFLAGQESVNVGWKVDEYSLNSDFLGQKRLYQK